ncbi:MAG: hypothetical protein JO187_13140 [Acidobacteria bacterium]|nr:hypothetical protein [Acidobacteriaceae bacterium]MBV9610499.1 hypothetical protein [Acidobacteriota bacterium]
MLSARQRPWYHSNRYTAESACEHCAGVIRHESWCVTQNQQVYEAYEAVMDPKKLHVGDQLILHALGVTWNPPCTGACAATPKKKATT